MRKGTKYLVIQIQAQANKTMGLTRTTNAYMCLKLISLLQLGSWRQEVHPSLDHLLPAAGYTSSLHQNTPSHSDRGLSQCICTAVHNEYNTRCWRSEVVGPFKVLWDSNCWVALQIPFTCLFHTSSLNTVINLFSNSYRSVFDNWMATQNNGVM